MTDLLGPGAAGAVRATLVRPARPADNPAGVDTWFQPCTGGPGTGTTITAEHLNAFLEQFRSMIRGAGVTEVNSDAAMLLKAAQRLIQADTPNWAGNFGGTANALTVSLNPAVATRTPNLLICGMAPLAPTGAVTINDGLGAVALTWPDGTPIGAGDWAPAELITMRFDGAAYRLLTPLSPAQIRSSVIPARSLKNLLLNGDFAVNQRVFAGGSLAASTYGYDRWKANGAGCSINVSSGVVTLIGTIEQIVENPQIQSSTITFSVANPSTALTAYVGGVTGTIPAGAGRQSVTLALGPGVTGNVSCRLTAAASTTFSDAQIEIGAFASAFDRRPIAFELPLLKRYYRKSYQLTVAPGTNLGAATPGSSSSYWQNNVIDNNFATASAGNEFSTSSDFDVEMRTVPTVTVWDLVGNIGRVSHYDSGSGHVANNYIPYNGGFVGAGTKMIYVWQSGISGIYGTLFGYSADAEL